jgi:hypothetical protein
MICEINKGNNKIALIVRDKYYYVVGVINNVQIQSFPMHTLSYAKREYDKYVARLP